VYRATDPRLGRDVAIKALPPEFSRDPDRLTRFEREARLLASLSHTNIAGIHGIEEVDDARYLVLEFVPGETLAARLARGPLPLDEAIEIARQIAAGVEAAHESGVVHRDLKPGNVMLTPSGAVKVLDFGLAKSGVGELGSSNPNLSASPTMTYAATQAGVILGTAAYMSPEQARGRAVDKRTDIWSFGCVLYECLAGRQAFEGETVSDLVARILQTEPDWNALPAAIPAHVRALLARCLQKDARVRLRDIGDARIALESPAEPEPRVTAPSRSRVASRWMLSAAGLAVAALVVATILWFGRPSRPGPVRMFDMLAKDLVVQFPVAPRLSPDGTRFAYASKHQIWVRDLSQLAPRPVAEVAEAAAINWSPDSRELVFGDQRKLWRVPVAGGSPTAICEVPGSGSVLGSAWSPSGVIAFAVYRGSILQVAASGGSPTTLVDVDPATQIDFHSPTWLPNGELMYITHWQGLRDTSGLGTRALMIFDGKKQIQIDGDFGHTNDTPVLTSGGQLLFLRGGATPGVWSAPFDLPGRRLTGAPTLVAPQAITLSVSADGWLLYVEGSRINVPRELVWVDRAGNEIGAVGKPHVDLEAPRLSPSGQHVAFSADDGGNGDIWVLDLSSGTDTRLTFDPRSEFAPEWLASSTRLSFVEQDGLQGRIQSINSDGSGALRTLAPTAPLLEIAGGFGMAPDGRSVLRIVDTQARGSLQIGAVLADGTLGPLKPFFSETPGPDVREARISPDGQLLAYVTNDGGRENVFLTRFPEGIGRWQVGTEGGTEPRWAGESGELIFTAGNWPSTRTIVAARVDPKHDRPLGAITRLFDLRPDSDWGSCDVTPDGLRLLFTRPLGGGSESAKHLVLVQNWQSRFEGDR
jgi:serine/threonine-protein kinase